MNNNGIAQKYQENKNCEQELAEIHESTSDSWRKLQLHCLGKANFTPKTELLIKSLSMKTIIQAHIHFIDSIKSAGSQQSTATSPLWDHPPGAFPVNVKQVKHEVQLWNPSEQKGSASSGSSQGYPEPRERIGRGSSEQRQKTSKQSLSSLHATTEHEKQSLIFVTDILRNFLRENIPQRITLSMPENKNFAGLSGKPRASLCCQILRNTTLSL